MACHWMKGFIHFFVIFFCTLVSSKEYDLLKTLDKKQSVISGVLNPGSLSFNGQEVYNGSESFAALLINKVPVQIKAVGGLKTFYFMTDETSLQLEWKTLSGQAISVINQKAVGLTEFKRNSDKIYYKSEEQIFRVQHPALTEFKTDGNNLYLKYNEHVAAARLDLKKLDLQDASYKIENFKEWLETSHTLELTAADNIGQIYNLDFRNLKNELLTTKSIAYSFGDSGFSSHEKPAAIGISWRHFKENQMSYETGLFVSNIYYEMPYGSLINKTKQSMWQLKSRIGYNPFYTNFGEWNYKRLTFGVVGEVINYNRESDYPTGLEGSMVDRFDIWYLQGGPFFRWEPLQYKKWGVFFNFDVRIFRTNESVSSDGDVKSIGFSYYY